MTLGLPPAVRACLFDLDGVLTQTAATHATAWKATFDEVLRERADAEGEPFVEFDKVADYLRYVDGRPRADGVRTFLASRGITLPEGEPDDPPSAMTVHGVGNRKNEKLLATIHRDGVEVFPDGRAYLEAARADGRPVAVVTSSANAVPVLEVTGLKAQVDVIVDGNVLAEQSLRGKPEPDTFLRAAADLGVEPSAAAVFEDALAGVQAGRAGDFGFVVGVDRAGQADALKAAGADVVVDDLTSLLGR